MKHELMLQGYAVLGIGPFDDYKDYDSIILWEPGVPLHRQCDYILLAQSPSVEILDRLMDYLNGILINPKPIWVNAISKVNKESQMITFHQYPSLDELAVLESALGEVS